MKKKQKKEIKFLSYKITFHELLGLRHYVFVEIIKKTLPYELPGFTGKL